MEKWPDILNDIEGPWEIRPNPMRTDGVFISQTSAAKPYFGIVDDSWRSIYQEKPGSPFTLPSQVDNWLAPVLVDLLNGRDVLRAEVARLRERLEQFVISMIEIEAITRDKGAEVLEISVLAMMALMAKSPAVYPESEE